MFGIEILMMFLICVKTSFDILYSCFLRRISSEVTGLSRYLNVRPCAVILYLGVIFLSHMTIVFFFLLFRTSAFCLHRDLVGREYERNMREI